MKKNVFFKAGVLLLSLLLLPGLSGCGAISGLMATPTPTATSTPTATPTPTATSTPTVTPTPTKTPIPTPTPLPRRLDNGTFIKQTSPLNGYGKLEIDNGTDRDAVAVLTTLTDETIFSVYIRSHSRFTVTGISDGNYKLFFTLGEDWDDELGRFTRKVRYSVFEDTFPYETTPTSLTVWSVTLHPVVGGTAETENLEADEFPPIR